MKTVPWGGTFAWEDNEMTDFKEMFVTPSLPDSVLKARSIFLFNEWMKGELEKYIIMQSYVQWPNEGTHYDTTTYEWRLKPEVVYDSTRAVLPP